MCCVNHHCMYKETYAREDVGPDDFDCAHELAAVEQPWAEERRAVEAEAADVLFRLALCLRVQEPTVLVRALLAVAFIQSVRHADDLTTSSSKRDVRQTSGAQSTGRSLPSPPAQTASCTRDPLRASRVSPLRYKAPKRERTYLCGTLRPNQQLQQQEEQTTCVSHVKLMHCACM